VTGRSIAAEVIRLSPSEEAPEYAPPGMLAQGEITPATDHGLGSDATKPFDEQSRAPSWACRSPH
jgi:hypothetical protein